MRGYEVDVPVRVMLWTRPECLKEQFEVLKKAAPSILFLVSDGGRNPEEKKKIEESRKIFENIDWECTVHKLYFDENQGMYKMMSYTKEFIWSRVDKCIFLEDDYIPAVSFFRFCAELLEKYKDDERIHMITGHNPFLTYDDAAPNDYFFTENGWSVWGTARWRRSEINREYPFDYADNEYIKRCIKSNMNDFWNKKVEGYCNGKLVDNHVPGGEYFCAVNSVLFHRLTIVPTKNMIKNIGYIGAHASITDIKKAPSYFGQQTFETEFPIKHPKYVIDDKYYGEKFDKLLGHEKKNPVGVFLWRVCHFIKLIFTGKAIAAVKSKFEKVEEK